MFACKQTTVENTSILTDEKSTSTAAILQSTIDTITISGKVKAFNADGSACFFVDPERVEQNITLGLGDKTAQALCTDSQYGNGVPVVFVDLDPNSYYPDPPQEDVLILVKGQWKTMTYQGKERVSVLYVSAYEPFF